MTIMAQEHTGRHGAVTVPTQRTPATCESIADIAERLMGEFDDRLDLDVISRTVLDCRDGLAGHPSGSSLELIEQLSRQLLQRTAQRRAEPHVR
jgi:hypothetical protein